MEDNDRILILKGRMHCHPQRSNTAQLGRMHALI